MTFLEKLNTAIDRNKSLLCIGLDPNLERIRPLGLSVLEFNKRIIDATSDLVCAYKPNVAFYDYLHQGHEILEKTLAYIKARSPDILIIGDSKRGDVDATSEIHAKVMFERFSFDAATVNPLPGLEKGVDAFLNFKDKGILVWCRSSNPGATDFFDGRFEPPGWPEDKERPLFYEYIAMRAKKWNEANNVGVVVGATYPEELKRVRELCPDMPILIPGVGAQQGDLERSLINGTDEHGRNAIISASRAVLYGSPDSKRDLKNFAKEARRVAEELRSYMQKHLQIAFKDPIAVP